MFIGLIILVVAWTLIFGRIDFAKKFGKIAMGFALFVTVLPTVIDHLLLSENSAFKQPHDLGTISGTNTHWGGWLFLFLLIFFLIAYGRFRQHRSRIRNLFATKPTSSKRRVDSEL